MWFAHLIIAVVLAVWRHGAPLGMIAAKWRHGLMPSLRAAGALGHCGFLVSCVAIECLQIGHEAPQPILPLTVGKLLTLVLILPIAHSLNHLGHEVAEAWTRLVEGIEHEAISANTTYAMLAIIATAILFAIVVAAMIGLGVT
jgi:hypothetical protein